LKAPAFAYVRAASLDHVYALLAQHGADAKLLAGGQSLIPALNMRLAAPALLIDINPLATLAGIALRGDHVHVGALTRHAELERSALIAEHLPLITSAMPQVAHVAIRTRGTFGGSIAFADPAAELPACCLALDATMVIGSSRGERRIGASEFFLDLYETVLATDEVVLAAEIPVRQQGEYSIFLEIARRHGDYASVGLALNARIENGLATTLRLAYFGAHRMPRLAQRASACLIGRTLDQNALAAAKQALRDDLEPLADIYHTAKTKLHLAGVILERALAQLPTARP
jgi:aerobic carbon-monoxide dehydrogenase medium subunit